MSFKPGPTSHVVSEQVVRRAMRALKKRALKGEPSAVIAVIKLAHDLDAPSAAVAKAEIE